MFIFRKALIFLIAAMFLLTACGGQKANEVKVRLTEFGIESSTTSFEMGIPYHFVVTNEGAVNHEIMIMPPATEPMVGMEMPELDEMALVMIEADTLPPGKTVSFDYTFTDSAKTEGLEFACHTPGHYEAGMKLPITVE
jgi:uncharacterized cupredoxin-like copper-binding protein